MLIKHDEKPFRNDAQITAWDYIFQHSCIEIGNVVCRGAHGAIQYGAPMVYFIISGKGTFTIDGKTIKVRKSDMLEIKPNSIFNYDGKMKLMYILQNHWDETLVNRTPTTEHHDEN